jgi:hypothetical protein
MMEEESRQNTGKMSTEAEQVSNLFTEVISSICMKEEEDVCKHIMSFEKVNFSNITYGELIGLKLLQKINFIEN